jgi:catechol 2,3-dioxygenase-like lactoylglutathione lyase family enzyme
MNLGTFSMSLSVADIRVSRSFYEKLGFEVIDGREEQNWLILKNGDAVVGLFEGMFPKNTLTFRPPDVRAVQRALKRAGIKLDTETDDDGTGTTSIALQDPDGNPILMDQPMTAAERAEWDKQHGG